MTPQETDPDLPMSVQESLAETWVSDALLQGRAWAWCGAIHGVMKSQT